MKAAFLKSLAYWAAKRSAPKIIDAIRIKSFPWKKAVATFRGNRVLYAQAINRYSNPSINLKGCENDLALVSAHAEARGYAIKWLKDEQATRTNILANLRGAVAEAKEGKRVRYWLSGHGTRIRDRNRDELDGQDGAIVSHDCKAVLDDEVAVLLSPLTSSDDFGLILDCCHSGEFPRAFPPGLIADNLAHGAASLVLRAVDPHLVDFADAFHALQNVRGLLSRTFDKAAVLTASTEKQVSMEVNINGRKPYGIFTWLAMESLTGDQTFKQIRDDTAQKLKRKGYEQEPQVRGQYGLPLL